MYQASYDLQPDKNIFLYYQEMYWWIILIMHWTASIRSANKVLVYAMEYLVKFNLLLKPLIKLVS